MKKFLFIFVVLTLLLIGFSTAKPCTGDGRYDLYGECAASNYTLVADNGYSLKFTYLGAGGVTDAFGFNLISPNGEIVKVDIVVEVSNEEGGPKTAIVNDSDGNPIIKLEFYHAPAPDFTTKREVAITSIDSNQIDSGKQPFFSMVGRWFKCLFSRKC